MSWLRWLVVAYGAINIVGGVIGFVSRGSTMSIAVGVPLGLLLVVLGLLVPKYPAMAYRIAGAVTLGLIAFWIYRITGVEKKMMPAMNIALGGLVMFLLVYGHFAALKHKRQQQGI